jgi:CTP:molybdopterin cytidylyltransferase MocA
MDLESLSIVATVSAGGRPHEGEPLFEYTKGRPKATLPIAGQPMITRIVETLSQTRGVAHIVVVALDPAVGVEFPAPVEYVPDAGDLIANAEAGLRYAMDRYPNLDAVLLCSADVPLITPAIVEHFITECFRTDHDLYYPVIERSVMEKRFPESRRSYAHLREGDFAGGDIFLARPSLTVSHVDLMQELAGARKSVLRQARMIGLWTFLKLATRRLTLEEAAQRVGKVLNIRARVMPFPYAEVGMDVDKAFQFDIVRAEIEARSGIPTS